MRKDYTHISIVLDRSGSMAGILSDTIGGYNTFLRSQKEAPSYATITLRMFATAALPPEYDFVPILNAPELGPHNYAPGGMTALYDAIGLAISETGQRLGAMPEASRPSHVLFVILTDGLNNHSHKHTYDQVAAMIKHQSDVYKWEFVFLGANQNAMQTAQGLNIGAGQTMAFAANSVGTVSLYKSLGEKLSMFRAGAMGQSFAFDSFDRDAQSSAGVDPALNTVAPKDGVDPVQ
jgi:hypothetical protein